MTTPPGGEAGNPLADVAAAFRRAWDGRSAAERNTFLASLGGTAPSTSTDPAALRALHERAALSGAVAPRDLVRDQPPEAAMRLLDLTSTAFDRTSTPDGWRWTLRSGTRRAALTHLVTEGRVEATLDAVVPLPTDPAGGFLREIAARRTSGDMSVPPITADTPDAAQALSWARPLGGVAADLAELRRRSAVTALRSDYDVLLTHGVIGRGAELADLRAFVDAPVAESGGTVPVASVVGIGGAGKSTLIADLIRPYHERLVGSDADAPIVVVVDFDRVHFRGEAQLDLSYELSMQIGWAVPEAGADFSVLRYQLRKQRDESSEEVFGGSSSVPEGDVRDSSAFDTEAATIVALHGLGDRAVLLVLDTFEEWQSTRIDPWWPDRTGWNDPETRVWEWVAGLRDRMGLRGLRVVVSGRADATFAGRSGTADLAVDLGDLAGPDAETLLRTLGVPDEICGPLADHVGGNPLELRVASQFFQRLPTAERQAFLREGTGGTEDLDAALRSSVLYDRFLHHLPDDLRGLAHPGLVLRRVTPALVRDVLAPHCGLGDVSVEEADALTERLADQVWLVKRDADGLTHQPHLRQRMLRRMAGDPAHADTMRAIHAAAVEWYGSRLGDPARRAAETEWLYHSLMLEPDGWRSRLDDPTERARWTAPAVALGSSVEELPPGVRDVVRFLRNDDLGVADGLALPPALAAAWFVRHGDDLVQRGRAEAASELFDVVRSRPDLALGYPPWLARAFCEDGRWSRYWSVTEQPGAPGSDPDTDLSSRTGRYAALDAICSDYPAHWTTFCRGLAHVVERFEVPRHELAEQAFLEVLAATAAPGTPQYGTPLSTLRSVRRQVETDADAADDLFPVDQLRRMQVWVASGSSRPFTLRRFAGLVRPDPDWVERFAGLLRLRGTIRLEEYLRDLRRLARGTSPPSIDLLLGETSLQFVRLAKDRVEVAPGALRADADTIRMLRGDNPELRPAVAKALAEAVGPSDPGVLAALAQSALPIPVSDLQADALPPGGDTRVGSVLTQMVNIVDRAGVLLPFLTAAADRLPETASLQAALRAVRRWDAAQERMIDALQDPRRDRSGGDVADTPGVGAGPRDTSQRPAASDPSTVDKAPPDRRRSDVEDSDPPAWGGDLPMVVDLVRRIRRMLGELSRVLATDDHYSPSLAGVIDLLDELDVRLNDRTVDHDEADQMVVDGKHRSLSVADEIQHTGYRPRLNAVQHQLSTLQFRISRLFEQADQFAYA